MQEDDVLEFDKIKWYSEEDEMADVFFKVFIRIAELKFNNSEHDVEELEEFVQKYNMPQILEELKPMLMEESLLEDYQNEIVSHEVIYSKLGLLSNE